METSLTNTAWGKLTSLLEMIKFSHTVFAFPFALMGVVLASLANGTAPTFGQIFWVCIAMIGARTGAMGLNRIIDARIYEQSETPGLGARIVEPDFCERFEGLKLGTKGKLIGIRQAGTILKNSEVHSITGATQTCVRLEKLINDGLAQWQEGSR